MLILLSMKGRMSNITVGRGFEPLFPNARVSEIVVEMNPYLKQKNYAEALLHSAGEIASFIAHEKGVALTTLESSSSIR